MTFTKGVLSEAPLVGQDSHERTLRSGFLHSARNYADRPAVCIGDESLTYAQLRDYAAAIAATLTALAPARNPRASIGQGAAPGADRLTAVFGQRTFTAFAGVLGTLFRGHGYVPLNPRFPAERNAGMLRRSLVQSVIVEQESVELFAAVLERAEFEQEELPLTVLIPDAEDVAAIAKRFPEHQFLGKGALRPTSDWELGATLPSSIAYLMFTSGSTGVPKGVMVQHQSALHFIDSMASRYGIVETDRLSQNFDLTFDLSIFDMFVGWGSGACLCVPTQRQKLFPDKYIIAQDITVWFSVPSTVVLMKKLRMLGADKFPAVRYSLFCGEALPLEVARAFAEATPNSVVDNLYGPTELTVACTGYRYDADQAAAESENGVVPIGEQYPQMNTLIVDEQLNEVPLGTSGELLLSGPQVAFGYWQDEETTNSAFVVPPGKKERFYRTGDRAVKRRESGPLLYLGRIDNQIKVKGYRVELDEIEAIVREAAETDVAVCVGYPCGPTGADGIVGFVCEPEAKLSRVREVAIRQLPPYMQPSAIYLLSELPLNANGKVDRQMLLRRLESGEFAA